jgi:hypothetical protein
VTEVWLRGDLTIGWPPEGALHLTVSLLDHIATTACIDDDQTLLVAAFEQIQAALRERNQGRLDPRQVIRACLATGYRHLNSLDEAEYEAVEPDLVDEIDGLNRACDPERST